VCEKERQADQVREELLAHLKGERIEPAVTRAWAHTRPGRKGCTFDCRMSGSGPGAWPAGGMSVPRFMVGQPCSSSFQGAGAVMTPDQARRRARRMEQDLLVAEAEQAAFGWMYLTVEGIDIESEPDLERYLRALDAFGEVAAGRQCRYRSTSSCLTFGIRGEAAGQTTRGEDASERIAVLHARLDALNPSGLFGARWDIRDGAR
jgi:hypothetical protein